MTNYQRALTVLVVAALGIWGCAQGPAGGASAEKIKSLETKVARLESDFKAASAARDQLQQQVESLQPVVKERDDLKTKVAELESVAQQFDGFRKNLKELLGKTEAALAKPASSTVTVSQPKRPNL